MTRPPPARLHREPARRIRRGKRPHRRREGRELPREPRRDGLRGGRIRLGQIRDLAVAPAAGGIRRRAIVSGKLWFKPQGAEAARSTWRRPRPRTWWRCAATDRHDLPGADDGAEPGLHHRRQLTDGLRRHRGLSAAEAERAGAGTPAGGAPARARTAAAAIPARAVRRHAPARGDRHGHGLPPAASDRGRTHHRARRHDPGRDPRPHQPAEARIRDGRPVHHPRHGGGGTTRRPRRGDAAANLVEEGPGRAHLRRPAGGLHQGAAGLGAQARRDARQTRARAASHSRRTGARRAAAKWNRPPDAAPSAGLKT
jgi:hypothetical protein